MTNSDEDEEEKEGLLSGKAAQPSVIKRHPIGFTLLFVLLAAGISLLLYLLLRKSPAAAHIEPAPEASCVTGDISPHPTNHSEPLCFNFDSAAAVDVQRGMGMCTYSNASHAFPFEKEGMQLVEDGVFRLIDGLRSLTSSYKRELVIKTFYAYISSVAGTCGVSLPQLVAKYNQMRHSTVTLHLGVYQFQPKDGCSSDTECGQWSEIQLQTARTAIQNSPEVLASLIVGNENLGNSPFIDSQMGSFIKGLQAEVVRHNLTTPVGTAQMTSGVQSLLTDPNYSALKSLLTRGKGLLGGNIYPYWGGVKIDQSAQNYLSQSQTLCKQARDAGVPFVTTEEGWPTQSSNGQPGTNLVDAMGYAKAWMQREMGLPPIASCYFQGHDVWTKATGNPDNAENNWGMLAANADPHHPTSLLDGRKAQALGDQVVFFDTDFSYPLLVMGCHRNNKNACWPINSGQPGLSEVYQGLTTSVVMNVLLAGYSRLLVIWDLTAQQPPAWCEIRAGTSMPSTIFFKWQQPPVENANASSNALPDCLSMVGTVLS